MDNEFYDKTQEIITSIENLWAEVKRHREECHCSECRDCSLAPDGCKVCIHAEKMKNKNASKTDPAPKFEVGKRVFASISRHLWVTHGWAVVKELDPEDILPYKVEFINRDKHLERWCKESDFTLCPNWLEEFGDSKEGRKRLADELLKEDRGIQHLCGETWIDSTRDDSDLGNRIRNILMPDFTLDGYRFAPEAGK